MAIIFTPEINMANKKAEVVLASVAHIPAM